jgi:hypothetical protein
MPTNTPATPRILVDVDGVLNPFGAIRRNREIYTPRTAKPDVYWNPGDHHLTVYLRKGHGAWLNDLADKTGAELTWASAWSWAANDWIGSVLELPWMPYVYVGDRYGFDGSFAQWKAMQIAKYVKGDPFVWFDDEPDAGQAAAEAMPDTPHKVIFVDSRDGLTFEHVQAAYRWLRRLKKAAA